MTTPIKLKYRSAVREASHRRAIYNSAQTANGWYRSVCNTAAKVEGAEVPSEISEKAAVGRPRLRSFGSVSIKPTDEEREAWQRAADTAGWPLHTWILIMTDVAAGHHGSLAAQVSRLLG